VDMFNALMKGDWATVGMCALGFVPGMKALKGLKVLGKSEGLLGKIGKYGALRKEVKAAGLSKELRVHHIVEKRFATVIGKKPGEISSVILTREQHQIFTNKWREAVKYGSDYSKMSVDDIAKKVKVVYADDSDLMDVALNFLGR